MFAAKLQELRKRAEMSQGQLAHQMSLDASLISRWEKGERVPSLSQQVELARLLGVTVDYLARGRLHVEIKFRAGASLASHEKKEMQQALTEAQQQLHFVDEVYRRAGKQPKPFLFNVDLQGQQWEEAAAEIRDLLRLNRRVTYDELKQALIERNVHVFAWHLPAKLSGLSYRGNFAAIFINQDQTKERRLFTLTHEVVHLLSHLRADHEKGKEVAVTIASNRDPQEKEANRLAAELLMPTAVMKELVKQYGSSLKKPMVLDQVAKFFNVSRDAIFYRLAADFDVFGWHEKSKYLAEFAADDKKSVARVDRILDQVSPDFLQAAMVLYGAEEISAGKLAEWMACPLRIVEEYLSQSEKRDPISAVLSSSF